MAELFTLDQAALDQFTTELLSAGFEPVAGTDRRCWQGPISPSFAGLTTAITMRLLLRDGWPFRHPYLMVDGLVVEHVNDEGVVCLWREDDNSRSWIYLEGIMRRIEEWCERANAGFRPTDQALDAYLGFTTPVPVLATFDLDALKPGGAQTGQSGSIHGLQRHRSLIELRPGAGPTGSIRGHWFHAGNFEPPPRNLDELSNLLTDAQRRELNKSIGRVATGGGSEIVLALGRRHGKTDTLIPHLFSNGEGGTRVESMEPAPTDHATLKLRAGPDAPRLEAKRVMCFGLGAVGSHTALLLAESGVGHLRLVDGELLRPGNVVRHSAGHNAVGLPKVLAVEAAVRAHAPWTTIDVTQETVWDASTIAGMMSGMDLILDTTGAAPIAEILSRIAERERVFLLSVALYRGGAVGRVRRQLPGKDISVYLRGEDARYPLIPPGPGGEDCVGMLLEPGCSAPVNNAPPSAVAAISALGTQVAIDALTGTLRYTDEVVDVYEPIEEPPFQAIGRVAQR